MRLKLDCEMKLCGGKLKKYPVKFGDLYVWIWGNQAEDVEKAVEMVQNERGRMDVEVVPL